uniref:Kinesin family member 20A n=1 Tax=Paramormyrops kingsleyae TaxID=1676925 RepID=A0A3B3SX39_9TELE
MAVCLALPCAALSDEDEATPTVMESTAADVAEHVGPRKGGTALPEVSFISPGKIPVAVKQDGAQDDGSRDRVRVYLRVRPLIGSEGERGEEQGCVCVQDKQTLVLRAPRDSFNMKSSERGVSQSKHCFTFTQIFGPEMGQQEFFEGTMKEAVWDVLRGDNRLLYTYGVTNSGKTYTVQGTGREAGLLPRTLVAFFQKLGTRLYPTPDLKPVLCREVRWLSRSEVRAEEIRRDALLGEESPVSHNSRLRGDTSTSCDSGIGGLSMAEDSASLFLDANSLSGSGGEGLPEGMRFSIWVSFFEIYNEFLYDLLGAPSPRKRATLRLCDDRNGNPYVKDLTWVQVRSAEEAWKVLKVGRRNQSLASTHLNHSSSRSKALKPQLLQRLSHPHKNPATGGPWCVCVCELRAPGVCVYSPTPCDRPPLAALQNLRQLRADLQRLGQGLREAEHACCHKTGGERLRGMLVAAEEMLGKQNQALVQIQRDWQLVKADLRQKTESLASLQRGAPTATGWCRKRSQRGVGSDPEDQHLGKKPFLYAASRDGTPARGAAHSGTPYSRILRARQPSPPLSPSVFKPRFLL